MAGLITSWKRVGGYSWKATWSGTSPFRLYIDGIYIDGQTTTDTERIFQNSSNTEPPALEVLDSTDGTAQNITYPPRLIVQWRGDPDSIYYRVERYESSVWVHKAQVKENGLGYYQFLSEPIDDGATEQWQVLAYDSQGNESQPLQITIVPARNPAPPAITVTYDELNTEFHIAAA